MATKKSSTSVAEKTPKTPGNPARRPSPLEVEPQRVTHDGKDAEISILAPDEQGPGAADVRPSPLDAPPRAAKGGAKAAAASAAAPATAPAGRPAVGPIEDLGDEPEALPAKLDEDEEEEEPEKDIEAGLPLEDQEGIDDPVRMYLR